MITDSHDLRPICWIDGNSLLTPLLKKIFTKEKINVYFHPTVENIDYLTRDLTPKLIVIDNLTLFQNMESFKKQYHQEPSMHLCSYLFLVDSQEELEQLNFIQNNFKVIEKPYDPFSLPQKLR